jgi:hypothetical protein
MVRPFLSVKYVGAIICRIDYARNLAGGHCPPYAIST